jgi:hypothetical protein
MTDNIGKSAFPAVQACPAFPSTFHIPLKGALDMPCLIPCAIDQVGDRTCMLVHTFLLLYIRYKFFIGKSIMSRRIQMVYSGL